MLLKMLYPVTNRHRTVLSLSGIWNFQPVPNGYRPLGRLPDPRPIGVPASYNELYTDAAIRDHVGLVCYETELSLPAAFSDSEVRLRIGAAGNAAAVYLDGELLGTHAGGFLPIDLEIPRKAVARENIRLSVVLDNRLDFTTLPIGETVIEAKVTLAETMVKRTVRGVPVTTTQTVPPTKIVPAVVTVEAEIPEQIARMTSELTMLFRASVNAAGAKTDQEAQVLVNGVNLPAHAPIVILNVTPEKVRIVP